MDKIKKLVNKVPKSFYKFLVIGGSATLLDFIIYNNITEVNGNAVPERLLDVDSKVIS